MVLYTTASRGFASLGVALLAALAVIFLPVLSVAQSPPPTSGPTFMRAGKYFYIQGGSSGSVINASSTASSTQLYALDISTSWPTSSPPWTALANGILADPGIGVSTANNQTLIVFYLTTVSFTLGEYSIQNNTWQKTTVPYPETLAQGYRPVTNPDDGFINLVGPSHMNIFNPQLNTWQTIALPTYVLSGNGFGGAVYNSLRKSILYMAGYSTVFASTPYITEYLPNSGTFQNWTTTGDLPTPRADLCMASSEDGRTIVVFGGRLLVSNVADSTTFDGSLYILDVTTGVWTQGPSSSQRIYASCLIVGTQFLVWGGWDGVQSPLGSPLVFDLVKNQWVDSYTAPSYYQITASPTLVPGTAPSSGSSSSSSSSPNLGAILGGVFGALFVIATAVAFVFYRRSKRGPAKYDTVEQTVAAVEAEQPSQSIGLTPTVGGMNRRLSGKILASESNPVQFTNNTHQANNYYHQDWTNQSTTAYFPGHTIPQPVSYNTSNTYRPQTSQTMAASTNGPQTTSSVFGRPQEYPSTTPNPAYTYTPHEK